MKQFILIATILLSFGSFANETYKQTKCRVLPGTYVGYRYGKENLIEDEVTIVTYKNALQFYTYLKNTETGKHKTDSEGPTGSITLNKFTKNTIKAESLDLTDAYPSTLASVELEKNASSWKGMVYYAGVEFNIECPEFETGEYEE